MNFEAMFQQMNSQQSKNNNDGWQQMGTVTIPPEEGYERERTFQLGYEAQSLPCKHITELLNKFTVTLRDRCAKEGIQFQARREGGGVKYLLGNELYNVKHEGWRCTWNYEGNY
jgi:hypothetical protein